MAQRRGNGDVDRREGWGHQGVGIRGPPTLECQLELLYTQNFSAQKSIKRH
jgi:hypothetical protein